MQIILNGIQVGLLLAILLGPIFFALIQTGVERGLRAGTMVGLGIWISDLLFISVTYAGLNYITPLKESEDFIFYVGLIGGFVLIAVGVGTVLTKPPSWDQGSIIPIKASYFSLWLKGFLVNTINPFTLVFWITMMGATVGDQGYSRGEAFLFFGATMGTIIVSDFSKVALAKYIRKWLQGKHILWIRWISGGALIVFGVVLIIRSVI